MKRTNRRNLRQIFFYFIAKNNFTRIRYNPEVLHTIGGSYRGNKDTRIAARIMMILFTIAFAGMAAMLFIK